MNIKFKLVKFIDCILFQIIEQTGVPANSYCIVDVRGIIVQVRTCSCPEITFDTEDNIIYLRGDDSSKDSNIAIFKSNLNINEKYNIIIESIGVATKSVWIND